jgi:PAS domain S-box-containing protein
MGFEGFIPWQPWARLDFLTPLEIWEYFVLALYVLVAFVLLVHARRDFKRLTWPRLLLFAGLLVAQLLASSLFTVTFSSSRPLLPPGVPFSVEPSVALLGVLPIVVAGAWLGPGPALVMGLVGGVLRAGIATDGVADPFGVANLFSFGFLGFLIGSFLHQDYRGHLPLIVRQPVVAAPLATMLALPLMFLSILAHTASSRLSGLDYALTLTGAYLVPLLLQSLVAAIVVLPIYLFFPRLRPVRAAYRFPPYARTLNRRLLLLFVPLILFMTIALLYAVTTRTLGVATSEVVHEMEREASGAADDIVYFIHVGHALLEEFANDKELRESDPIVLEDHLRGDLRTLAFFDQLLLFDLTGRRLAMYPPRVAESGATQISTMHLSKRQHAVLSFLAPVEDEAGIRFGVLLGRTRLDINPVMAQVLASLQGIGARGDARGEGFIVQEIGEKREIAAHSDPDMLLATWEVGEDSTSIATTVPRGLAYEGRDSDNTRQLVYYLPVEGYDSWAVVIRLPYEIVLEQAAQIATPLLILQILLGGGLLVVILFATGWLTRPLQQLAAAADRIAEGDLTQPVRMSGSDEVARVGDAFEGMRVRLKGRVEDLSLLLQISQAVSATLELTEGMPSILDGALRATQAQVARVVLLPTDSDPQMVMSRGELGEGLEPLDRALTDAVRHLETPLVVENMARARTLADPETLSGPVKSVIALPVRTMDRLSAVMWVGYGQVRQFGASEIDLLSTLASQTAVLVENANLFQAAEGGRRRLAAILASTSDAVLVTDRDDCILLVNPAAERAFGVAADAVVGRRVDETQLSPALARAFGAPLSPGEALTEEVLLPDGRTLYASVSTILSADGEQIGRVAMMRDITRFKELDELKSEFVATVSHDLRAPLTFMRGYATMLPMVGELGEKQRDYVEKILRGVGQMSGLIDDLLDLGRIEAGVGLERKPCHLGAVLVEAVDGMRARAIAKGLTLRLEPAEGVAVISGDVALLRQAAANLVDNAIKYTPSGGVVTVGLAVRDEQVVIRVADTGIGIDPDDQVRLFEKFFRIRRRDTADIPGTGLGLAIVKSIIERHGGRVWVESELNRGSTFYVSLPLGGAEALESRVA